MSLVTSGPHAYATFLAGKHLRSAETGHAAEESLIPSGLFPFQRDVVRWATRRGTAALFEACGLGKTAQQLSWARQIPGDVLILTPLAVAEQTQREAVKFGLEASVCRTQADVRSGISVTNYEKLEHFDPASFVGVVLDESAILKDYSGKTKRRLVEAFRATPYKLCCTATPAPNDHVELGNHAEFLGIEGHEEMLARWFINDSMRAGVYRLKGYGEEDFWDWVHSWAVSIELPSDIGYSDEGFILPPLSIEQHTVASAHAPVGGALFHCEDLSATTMHQALRASAPARAEVVAGLVNGDSEPWLVWCNANYEADELMRRIPDAIEVRGSDSEHVKTERLIAFSEGRARVMVTKPSVAGHGLNWQHCAHVAFTGLSYSWEQYHQAIRRCWRFGQARPVKVHVVCAEAEGGIAAAIRRKEEGYREMRAAMQKAMKKHQLADRERIDLSLSKHASYETERGPAWTMHRGDCVRVLEGMAGHIAQLSIHSPPFSNLYIYSDAAEDMGNSADHDEFFEHYRFLIRELYRVTQRGRIAAVHCKDLPLYKNRDGAAGLYDFPGEIVREFMEAGWTYHSRVTIWKCPVTEMQRTKNHGLLYGQLCKDSTASRMGMADYVLAFRKWDGQEEFPDPVPHARSEFPLEQWQRWASPVWDDINQMRVLNVRQVRNDDSEKHICPLQLDVIERCVRLWSNPGDLVLSPFAGIGSEGYVSLLEGRRFVGVELKREYFDSALSNLRLAEHELRQGSLYREAASQ